MYLASHPSYHSAILSSHRLPNSKFRPIPFPYHPHPNPFPFSFPFLFFLSNFILFPLRGYGHGYGWLPGSIDRPMGRCNRYYRGFLCMTILGRSFGRLPGSCWVRTPSITRRCKAKPALKTAAPSALPSPTPPPLNEQDPKAQLHHRRCRHHDHHPGSDT